MQPTLTQVPPKRPGSAIATRAPSVAEMRLARTPPDPPPMLKRSKSNFGITRGLLQVLEVHSDEIECRGHAHVLRLVGKPFHGVVDALLDLRRGHAFDADEHLREVAQSRRSGVAAYFAQLGLDRGAVEIGHQLHGSFIAHRALLSFSAASI